MSEKPAEFDFDEWADLFRRDPQAFEARRQAVLALELAKGTPGQAAAARKRLKQFEQQNENASPEARTAAGQMMLEDVQRLNEQMSALSGALQNGLAHLLQAGQQAKPRQSQIAEPAPPRSAGAQ
ncbi:MAG: hypothetical protein R3E83_23375 [Burkholderiaceae bacterium]